MFPTDGTGPSLQGYHVRITLCQGTKLVGNRVKSEQRNLQMDGAEVKPLGLTIRKSVKLGTQSADNNQDTHMHTQTHCTAIFCMHPR